MLKISVEENITKAFDALERELEKELRALASQTGQAIRDTAKATVAVDEGVTRDNIVSEDGDDATRVFVRSTPDRPTNLDIYLEFGTRTIGKRPFLHPAKELHRPRYVRETEQRIRAVTTRVGGR
jgi:HK97 gp10 family phage protein